MLPDYKSGLFFTALKKRHIHLVTIVIQNTSLVAAESTPGVNATSAGSGVYNLTFPKGLGGSPLSAPIVGLGSQTPTSAEWVTFDAVAGTAQIDTNSDLAGGDRCYVHILLEKI